MAFQKNRIAVVIAVGFPSASATVYLFNPPGAIFNLTHFFLLRSVAAAVFIYCRIGRPPYRMP